MVPSLSPWSDRLFRGALRLTPRGFRDEHGEELLETLAAREADIRTSDGSLWTFRWREARAIVRVGARLRRPRRVFDPSSDPGGSPMPPAGSGRGAWRGIRGDMRAAWRGLRRHPGQALVAVVTLMVAVGAATAVFTVVNAVILTPLPYPHSDRLALVRDASPPRFPFFSVSPGRFVEWQRRARTFDGLAATTGASANLTGAGEDPERLRLAQASANLFDVLGVSPLRGRTFTAEEDRDGGPRAIILSEGLWRSRFGGRDDVIGRTITVGDLPTTVVGVMPASFQYPSDTTRAWVPLALSEEDRQRYGSHYLRVVGRLRDGETVASARDDLRHAAEALAQEHPSSNESWTVLVDGLHDYTIRDVRGALLLLVAAGAGVLLIACANVAGLLLARGADRQREIAVRSALGADRLRLMRPLFFESLLLGAAGAAGGVLVGLATLRALLATSWARVPRFEDVSLDPVVLAFAVALAVLTPVLFGLLPALQASRTSATGALVAGGRSHASTLRRGTRSWLIVGEVALAVMLVTGSALLLRSLDRLLDVTPGFQPDHVLSVGVSLPESRYPTPEARTAFFRDLLERTGRIPGVERAAQTQVLPFVGDYVASLEIDDQPTPPNSQPPTSNFYAVSPGYFDALGIRLLRGRDFTDADRAEGPRVAIVSRQLAERLFPGVDALGHHIRVSQGPRRDFAEIVGVVDDVQVYGLDADMTLQIYEPAAQHGYFTLTALVLRTATPPATVVASVRRVMRDLDPDLPVDTPLLLADEVAASTAPRRFTAALLGGLAGVALLLAAVGIYGLVSFSVGRRVQEFGVRMALGAAPGTIMRLVLGEGLRLAAAGVGLGLVGALLAGRVMQSLLFHVSARDPIALAGAALVIVAAAALACYSPARRALRVSPVTALRET
ncbi:MAG: ABC transporter permease [Vicinamibacterales bacterium]